MRPVCSEPLNFHTILQISESFIESISSPKSTRHFLHLSNLSTFPAYPRWRNRWISPFDLPCSRSRTPLTSAFTFPGPRWTVGEQGEQLTGPKGRSTAGSEVHRTPTTSKTSPALSDHENFLHGYHGYHGYHGLRWKPSRGRTCQTRSLLLILFSIHLHFQHGIPLWSKHLKCWELQTWKH